MIASPTFSLAEIMVARMRRDEADRARQDPGPSAGDTSPPTLSPLSTDWDLLLDYLSPSLSVGTLCTRHALSPGELADFLARTDVQRTLAVIQSIAAARLPLLDLHLPQAIRATHLAIVSQPPPEDPRIAARHAETARKSANALERIARRASPLDASMPPASMPSPSIITSPSHPAPPRAPEAAASRREADRPGASARDGSSTVVSINQFRVPLVRGGSEPRDQCELATATDNPPQHQPRAPKSSAPAAAA